MYRVGDVVRIRTDLHLLNPLWFADPMSIYENKTAIITNVIKSEGVIVYRLSIDRGVWFWPGEFFREPITHNSADLYDLWSVIV